MGVKERQGEFCPKCGGRMEEGECSFCGFRPGETEDAPDKGHCPGGYRTAVLAGLAAFALLLSLAMFLLVRGASSDGPGLRAAFSEFLEQFRGGREEDDGEDYVPSSSDEYYKKITDALRSDLSYRVRWLETDLERREGDASFYALYPELEGELPNRDSLNGLIAREALFYRDSCQLYLEQGYDSCHVQSFGYVTYMDEERLSIVYDERVYLNDRKFPGLFALNIDVRTGTVLKLQDLLVYDRELAECFRSRVAAQNGEELDKELWTDALLSQLLSSESGVAFYTPVGLELGFNYNGVNGRYGWVTATIKDYERFLQR
ncbi:MAG: hypothetical protein Q4C65_00925 [Eubacteriales bacterium]|nr:hypothetical protein [Eubacteriales bacterium]